MFNPIEQDLTEEHLREISELGFDIDQKEEYKVLTDTIINDAFSKVATLGVDIYKYSQYKLLAQTLVPMLFLKIRNVTYKNCLNSESFLFQGVKRAELEKRFIDIGDGGFFIFKDPLQALIFSIYFQANMTKYNSGHADFSEYHDVIGPITFRYCMTFDFVYSFNKNFYGSGIINNARILSKDKLNRYLIDENVLEWFIANFRGVENLSEIDADTDFAKLEYFSKLKGKPCSGVFHKKLGLKDIIVQKIGEVKSKATELSVYSNYFKVRMDENAPEENFNKYTVTLGNLNPSGISD